MDCDISAAIFFLYLLGVVTNTGTMAGKEVVQLYVADKVSTVIRPSKELKEFAKVDLAPGETKTVTFTLGKRAFTYWNVELHAWHGEPRS